MLDFAKIIGMIGAIFIMAMFIGLLMSIPVMLCWNYVMPAVFGVSKITFLQALVLNILCSLLFKSGTEVSKK